MLISHKSHSITFTATELIIFYIYSETTLIPTLAIILGGASQNAERGHMHLFCTPNAPSYSSLFNLHSQHPRLTKRSTTFTLLGTIKLLGNKYWPQLTQ